MRAGMVITLLLVAGVCCGGVQAAEPAADGAEAVKRWYKPFHVDYGRQVFTKHCAACHGRNAEGAANWRKRDAGGRFPPPPLNGSAHGWHHPMGELIDLIRFSRPNTNMPAWDETLSPGDIVSVIAWFQSLWSDEVYVTWEGINERARARERSSAGGSAQ